MDEPLPVRRQRMHAFCEQRTGTLYIRHAHPRLLALQSGGTGPGLVITCDTATTTASGTGTLATRVRTLTDIIGMNIHIGSRAAGYTNDTTLLADLAYMGVYNVRDHLELNGSGSADTFALLATLGNNGIKLLLSVPPDANGGNLVVADTVTAAAAMINAIPAGMLIAIEGPNEPDNFQYWYNGVKQTINGAAQQLPGFLPIAQYSAALYTAIRANSTTAHLPIVGVSDRGSTDNSGMQFLTIPTGYNHNTLTTNASTARGSKVLHFASVPLTGSAAVQAGHFIYVAGVTSGRPYGPRPARPSPCQPTPQQS